MRCFYCLLLIISSLSAGFLSCDDYLETGIEGQWQMTKVLKSDGSEQRVDTIYYLFKKGVFKYLRMETDLKSFYGFGQYREHDGKLDLNFTDPWTGVYDNCLYWGIGVNSRTYDLKKHTSSALELEFEGDRYIFRKY
jgi:hypothetical protein